MKSPWPWIFWFPWPYHAALKARVTEVLRAPKLRYMGVVLRDAQGVPHIVPVGGLN